MTRDVDLVVLCRDTGELKPRVRQGISVQQGVRIHVHRIVGDRYAGDASRWETIARARNHGKSLGKSPWLMFLDDDVVLGPRCVQHLLHGLRVRPTAGALAADYLGERLRTNRVGHVGMGATMFRRSVLDQIRFRWEKNRCECQCCCDDLRRSGIGIEYFWKARAMHLQPSVKHGWNEPTPVIDAGRGVPRPPARMAMPGCPRIVVVNHWRYGYSGHFFNEALGLREEAARRGIQLTHLVNCNNDPGVVRAIGATRAFRYSFPITRAPQKPTRLISWLQRRSAEFAKELNRFLPRDLTRDDIVLVVSGGDAEATEYANTESVLHGLHLWARSRTRAQQPLIATHVHALYPPRLFPQQKQSLAARLLMESVGSRGFLPIVAVIELASPATHWFGRPVAVMGDAMNYRGLSQRTDARVESHGRSRIHVSFLGGEVQWRALDKGLGFLPTIVKHVAARYPLVRFHIQAELNTMSGKTLIQTRELLRHSAVKAVEPNLDPARYRDLVQNTDIMLLPYDPNVYRRRSSGIFSEALASGTVVVVSGGTPMANKLAAGWGAGIIFDQYNAASAAGAVARAVHQLQSLSEKARGGAEAWQKHYSAPAYLDRLLSHQNGPNWLDEPLAME